MVRCPRNRVNSRASGALAHLRKEFKYVDKWLRPSYSTQVQVMEVDEALIAAISGRAASLARDIEQDFSITDAPTAPRDIAQARERLALLVNAKQRIMLSFSEINGVWGEHPLGKERMAGVRMPIQKVDARIVVETKMLKLFIHRQQQQVDGLDWRAVCVDALGRAMTLGFQLTPSEKDIYDRLRTYMNSNRGQPVE